MRSCRSSYCKAGKFSLKLYLQKIEFNLNAGYSRFNNPVLTLLVLGLSKLCALNTKKCEGDSEV